MLSQKAIEECATALRLLRGWGADTAALQRWLATVQERREVRGVTDADRAWPLREACSMDEHLNGKKELSQRASDALGVATVERKRERPFLSCAIVAGRAYRLTAEQRQVILEWYNMTCSPEVMVEMLATFEGEPTVVRECVIRSEQHVDPQNLRVLNGPRKVTIDRWGDFCSAVANRKVENDQRREVDAMVARVARLLKKAKTDGVAHELRGPGDVAHEWHAKVQLAAVEGRTVTTEDVLTAILEMRGEDGLVALWTKSRQSTAGKRSGSGEFAAADAAMDVLMKELGL